MQTILVVDDDPLMLTSLADVLQSEGYRVVPAPSALEAFDVAAQTRFDLIVADVRMEGIDGIQCIHQLVDQYPHIKSIVITGYASDDAPGRAMEADTCDYLTKPFETDQLLLAVRRALQANQEGAGYQSLFHRLWGKAVAAVEKAGLESARDKAFQRFYVGVRSGHLGMAQALLAWNALEAAERQRSEPSAALKEVYAHIGAYCKSPATSTLPEGQAETGKVRFLPLFKNVREGKISCEQLKVAVYLKSLSHDQLSASQELEQLNQSVWTEG